MLDVSVAKKEKLYARLSDLEGEINATGRGTRRTPA